MRRLSFAAFIVALFVLGGAVQAQPDGQPRYQPSSVRPPFDQVVINTTDLGNGLYMLDGEGANMIVAVSSDGLIMVDTEFAELNDKIKAAIAAITDQPIRYLIITHFHRDHTGGNAGFAQDGAIIVAHENVRPVMETGSLNGLTGNVVPPQPEEALPQITYSETLTISLEDHTAQLTHRGEWHTDGDSQIYFPEADVLVAGDIVNFGQYPNIDASYGGNIDGMIEGAAFLLELANDNTKIVPGHGPVGTKAMMVAYRQMLIDARARVAQLIADGLSEEEAVAAQPNADYTAAFGTSARRAGNFVRVVYRSLMN